MSIPENVRQRIKDGLWKTADQIGWATLASSSKSRLYEKWTREDEIGGVLGRYMDRGQIRVYLKDTLLKDYTRERLANDTRRIFNAAGIKSNMQESERFIKPHGRRFVDGSVICWGRAEEW